MEKKHLSLEDVENMTLEEIKQALQDNQDLLLTTLCYMARSNVDDSIKEKHPTG